MRALRLAGAATAPHEAGGGAIDLIRPPGASAWLDDAFRTLGEAAEWLAGIGGRWDARLERLRAYLIDARQ